MFQGSRKPFLHGNGPLVQKAESGVRPVKFGEPLKVLMHISHPNHSTRAHLTSSEP